MSTRPRDVVGGEKEILYTGWVVEGNPRADSRHVKNYTVTRRDDVTSCLAICRSTLHCRNPIVPVTLEKGIPRECWSAASSAVLPL